MQPKECHSFTVLKLPIAVRGSTTITVKIPNSITTLIIGVLVTLVSLWYGQNNGLLPIDASAQATQIDRLFNTMLAISTGLFLVIQGALLYALFAFRRRPEDNTDAEPIHGNVPLEILWTAIPTAIVLWLAIYSFDVYKAVDRGGLPTMGHMAHAAQEMSVASLPKDAAIAAPLVETGQTDAGAGEINQSPQDPATTTVRNQEVPELREAPGTGLTSPSFGPTSKEKGKLPEVAINVTGLQFAWIFTYPESGVVSGELHVPVGQDVNLNISANDVIHAFWVPEFRLKQDAIPGRQARLRFTPSRIGTYPVICAELCGAYHGAMKTKVVVQTPEEYSAWLQSQRMATGTSAATVAAKPTTDRLNQHAAAMGLPAQLVATLDQSNPAAMVEHSHSR